MLWVNRQIVLAIKVSFSIIFIFFILFIIIIIFITFPCWLRRGRSGKGCVRNTPLAQSRKNPFSSQFFAFQLFTSPGSCSTTASWIPWDR